MSDLLPGYLTLPKQDEQDYDAYIAKRTQKPLRANQMSYWQNYPKFHVSLMKSWWGDAATADNNWCFDYLPKLDKPYDMLQAYELMNQGKIHGYICQGFNPLASAPNKGKLISAFSKLKFMVSMDPLETETIEFWQNHGAFNDVDPSTIQTEVFRLPTTCFAEENGAVVNSSRWLQWHWKGANPPGEARSDIEIMSELFHRIKAMYEKDGGAWWSRCATWPGSIPTRSCRRRKNWRWNTTARRWPTCSIRRTRPSWCARPASSWPLRRPARRRQHRLGCWIFSAPGARPAT
jgi:formate dehydrogenase major subunit